MSRGSGESSECGGSRGRDDGAFVKPKEGYRKLLAFQAAHESAKATYALTGSFPKAEIFGLTSQMRRAAVSVPANIVEGWALDTTTLFIRHLSISYGSCKELEYYIDLANELGYLTKEDSEEAHKLLGRTAYFVTSLAKSLRAKRAKMGDAHRKSLDSHYSLDSLHSEMEKL